MPVIWEIDFYSRPVLDDQQKKLWEVLICESPLEINTRLDSLFHYSQFCSNTEVNSVVLSKAIQEAIAQAPKPPDKIRFFRRQMTNMIARGCQEAGVPSYASRRTLALNAWIQERMETVYPAMPNYQAGTNPSVNAPLNPPQPLPDALIGQQWAFVTLEAGAFADMPEWKIDFGEAFPLELAKIDPKALIPGIIVFSPRALPLAAWMSGLELASLHLSDEAPARLLLETGISDTWILANLPKPQLKQEAEAFEVAKKEANGVHFLAVQANPQAEEFTGFWLMREVDLT
ncbi:MAG: Tab2/Atab2 family RNA-binding protein [Oculatellaceae cyanobacterium bins.114]|nr:Tab2/Atab2 family RNA-binding protein [Oculatellaceae cyanobacterium bins.114]